MNKQANSNLTEDDVPSPAGLYINSIESGGLVAISGQLPIHNGSILHTGRVGETVNEATAKASAKKCVENALKIAGQSLGEGWRTRVRVLRLSVYVACGDSSVPIPIIADSASQVLRDSLGDRGLGTRTAIGVTQLPANAPVEIELTLCLDGEKGLAA